MKIIDRGATAHTGSTPETVSKIIAICKSLEDDVGLTTAEMAVRIGRRVKTVQQYCVEPALEPYRIQGYKLDSKRHGNIFANEATVRKYYASQDKPSETTPSEG